MFDGRYLGVYEFISLLIRDKVAVYNRNDGIMSLHMFMFHPCSFQVIAMLKCALHSITAFDLGPGLIEVIMFGGTLEPRTKSEATQSKQANTTLLQFSECLTRTCNDRVLL